jgi:nitrogen fixation NifU-like protein
LYKKEEEETPVHEGPVVFYSEKVMDHFLHPRNVGEIQDADAVVVVGDPSCGDQLKIWLKVENDCIADITFKTFGCPGAIATSSMMTALAKGKSLAEAKKMTDDDIIDALDGIPERKKHCSLLGVTALLEGIKEYERKAA